DGLRKKRRAPSADQLRADHGEEKWEAVLKVLSGKRAQNPEEVVRARFSALRCKDPKFMAMSEISKVFKTEAERVRGWEVALGIEQPNEADDRDSGTGSTSGRTCRPSSALRSSRRKDWRWSTGCTAGCMA
ncbi:unnamed protein product, partial [Polarella glacialis]